MVVITINSISISFTYNEYKMGYKDSPCLSPTEHSKKSENMPFNLTHDFNLLYIDSVLTDTQFCFRPGFGTADAFIYL
jgi:hypothetical protein